MPETHTNGRLKHLLMTFESSKSISIFDVFFWVHSELLAASLFGFWAARRLSLGPFGRPWGRPEGLLGLPEAAHFRQNRPSFCIPHFGAHFGCSWATFGCHFGSPKDSRTLQNELDRAFSLAYLRLSSLTFSYVCLSLRVSINISISMGININIRILISVSISISINISINIKHTRGINISINISINIVIYICICHRYSIPKASE